MAVKVGDFFFMPADLEPIFFPANGKFLHPLENYLSGDIFYGRLVDLPARLTAFT
jgi:hypothetical protein